MRRYVEARLKRQNTLDDTAEDSNHKRAKLLSPEEEILFKVGNYI